MNIRIDELINKAYEKKIVFFGAGKLFREFIDYFKEYHIENYIHCVLDNDHNKNNTFISINGTDIAIKTVENFLSEKVENIIIVISIVDIEEIIDQLNSIREFDNTECYIAKFVIYEDETSGENDRFYPENLRITETPLIPKKIHYCWFGGNPIPDKYREWMNSWKKYCPDYEIIEWNESNYDITKNKYIYQAYQAKKWCFVSDYARLDVVYNYGGIYFDTDVELIKNPDDMLYQSAFMGFETNQYVATGLGFGAEKNHPVIKIMRDYYNDMEFIDKDGNMNLTTCDIHQTNFLVEKGLKLNGDYQIIDGMTIYPRKILCGKNHYKGKIETTENTISIHHYDASWCDADVKRIIKYNQELYSKLLSQ